MQRRIESYRSSTATTVADMAPSCACCGAQSNIPLNLTPRNARTADLLNSNACPLHVEELSFRAEIPARKKRIVRLDRAIADARRAVQDLIQQRQQEVRDLNDIETVMHPIRRLPADVLREIFLICLDDQDPRADSIDTNGMPWVLVQVCSQWRTTGVSFARLWSRVHVSFDTLALHPHPERLVHVLWLQLSRSKQYRLDLELSSYTHVSDMHPILPQLWSSSNRWRTLTIDVTDASVRNILAPTYGKLHALELVSIKTSDLHHDAHPDFDVLSDISTTPLLRSLHVNQTPMSLVIPWERLEEYVCYQPHFGTPRSWFEDPVNILDKNLAVLSKLTNVQTFKTRFSAFSPPSPMEQPLNHHCLTSLWLESPVLPAEIGVSEFLKVLVLPSLQTLGWLRWSDVAAAQALVERSKCTLLTLGIKPDTHSPSLRDLMRDSPSVETLVLKDQVDPAFFAILGGVLPELINLDMSEVIPAYAPEDKVWRIVTTRKRKLKDVRLPPGYESAVPVEEQFASFIQDGLNIGIYYA